jgi:hypothetical protein
MLILLMQKSFAMILDSMPLDFNCTPFFPETAFVKAGQDRVITATDTSKYQFGFAVTFTGKMLPEVKVRGRSNAEKFEDNYATGMFSGGQM